MGDMVGKHVDEVLVVLVVVVTGGSVPPPPGGPAGIKCARTAARVATIFENY